LWSAKQRAALWQLREHGHEVFGQQHQARRFTRAIEELFADALQFVPAAHVAQTYVPHQGVQDFLIDGRQGRHRGLQGELVSTEGKWLSQQSIARQTKK
jgi:hypothetical protein